MGNGGGCKGFFGCLGGGIWNVSFRVGLALDPLIVRHRSTDPGVLFLHVPHGVGPKKI